MFTAALFVISKTWKPRRCPSVGEQVNKLWYIQAMDNCSMLKRNEISSHENSWRKLKRISLSERSQFEKATFCIIHTCDILKRQNYNKNIIGCHGLRVRSYEEGEQAEHRGFWGSETILQNTTKVAYMPLYICHSFTKSEQSCTLSTLGNNDVSVQIH